MLHLHTLWLSGLIHVDVDGLPHDQAEDPLSGKLSDSLEILTVSTLNPIALTPIP